MAERCVAGELEGSAWRASHDPEFIRLGVSESAIRYHMNKVEDPAAVAARAAERARVATESAAAEAARTKADELILYRLDDNYRLCLDDKLPVSPATPITRAVASV